MNEQSAYKTTIKRLVSLPLFLGMTEDSMEEIIAHTRFDFHKYQANTHIINEGDPCDSYLLLTKGSIIMKTTSFNKSFTVEEILTPPAIIEPERLFGMSQHYFSSYTAKSDCNVIRIFKSDVMHLSSTYDVFLMNLLNLISTRPQRAKAHLWSPLKEDIVSKITSFIITHVMYPAGEKRVFITMELLSDYIHESRLHVSQTLHKLEKANLISMKRSTITVPLLEELISFSNSQEH